MTDTATLEVTPKLIERFAAPNQTNLKPLARAFEHLRHTAWELQGEIKRLNKDIEQLTEQATTGNGYMQTTSSGRLFYDPTEQAHKVACLGVMQNEAERQIYAMADAMCIHPNDVEADNQIEEAIKYVIANAGDWHFSIRTWRD